MKKVIVFMAFAALCSCSLIDEQKDSDVISFLKSNGYSFTTTDDNIIVENSGKFKVSEEEFLAQTNGKVWRAAGRYEIKNNGEYAELPVFDGRLTFFHLFYVTGDKIYYNLRRGGIVKNAVTIANSTLRIEYNDSDIEGSTMVTEEFHLLEFRDGKMIGYETLIGDAAWNTPNMHLLEVYEPVDPQDGTSKQLAQALIAAASN